MTTRHQLTAVKAQNLHSLQERSSNRTTLHSLPALPCATPSSTRPSTTPPLGPFYGTGDGKGERDRGGGLDDYTTRIGVGDDSLDDVVGSSCRGCYSKQAGNNGEWLHFVGDVSWGGLLRAASVVVSWVPLGIFPSKIFTEEKKRCRAEVCPTPRTYNFSLRKFRHPPSERSDQVSRTHRLHHHPSSSQSLAPITAYITPRSPPNSGAVPWSLTIPARPPCF